MFKLILSEGDKVCGQRYAHKQWERDNGESGEGAGLHSWGEGLNPHPGRLP